MGGRVGGGGGGDEANWKSSMSHTSLPPEKAYHLNWSLFLHLLYLLQTDLKVCSSSNMGYEATVSGTFTEPRLCWVCIEHWTVWENLLVLIIKCKVINTAWKTFFLFCFLKDQKQKVCQWIIFLWGLTSKRKCFHRKQLLGWLTDKPSRFR